jgi:F0F1-type ATP synthase membrane subunit c/vacuolar-type H+-ATPase subunit K
MVQTSMASILTAIAIATGSASAAALQGKAFNHILQVWFENQVSGIR